jgi:hypothetical protein
MFIQKIFPREEEAAVCVRALPEKTDFLPNISAEDWLHQRFHPAVRTTGYFPD